jgi:hypothetical protein
MLARSEMVQDVSHKNLPNRLSANAVDLGEVLLSRPLFDPHQSLRCENRLIRPEIRQSSSFPKHPAHYGMSTIEDEQQ